MKCAKCGAEIRPGCVYCSNCGQEAQIVTEINILEDDLLRSMLDEESEKTKETVSAELVYFFCIKRARGESSHATCI